MFRMNHNPESQNGLRTLGQSGEVDRHFQMGYSAPISFDISQISDVVFGGAGSAMFTVVKVEVLSQARRVTVGVFMNMQAVLPG